CKIAGGDGKVVTLVEEFYSGYTDKMPSVPFIQLEGRALSTSLRCNHKQALQTAYVGTISLLRPARGTDHCDPPDPRVPDLLSRDVGDWAASLGQ
ncbi:hypothetical protein BaRGS_00016062, partial [Batillaria attramentaria]